MNKYLFLAFLLACFSGKVSAQHPIDEATGKVCYSEVIETDLSKDQLYANAQDWIVKTFGTYKGTVQMEDKETGKIILKGRSDLNEVIDHFKYTYNYTVTIECKDNKYRYAITDIYIYIQNLLFSDLSKEYTLESQLDVRRIHIQRLDKLRNEDISKLSKREKKEKLHDINLHQSWINEDERLIPLELAEFASLQESLKKAMNIHNDF